MTKVPSMHRIMLTLTMQLQGYVASDTTQCINSRLLLRSLHFCILYLSLSLSCIGAEGIYEINLELTSEL